MAGESVNLESTYTQQPLPGYLRVQKYSDQLRDISQLTRFPNNELPVAEKHMHRYQLYIDINDPNLPFDIKKHFANYQLMGLDLWGQDGNQRQLEEKMANLKSPDSKVLPILFQCGLSSEPDQLDNDNTSLMEAMYARFKSEADNPDSPLYGYEFVFAGFSQPGFGKSVLNSGKIPTPSVEHVNDQAAAGLYEGVIEALGIPLGMNKALLCGHSAGGSALWTYLSTHPELAERSVLFNAALSLDKKDTQLFSRLLLLEQSSTKLLEIITATTKEKVDLIEVKNAISEVIMRALLGYYNEGRNLANLKQFVADAYSLVTGNARLTKELAVDQLTVPADAQGQARMHAKQSRYSRGLWAKLKALAEVETPITAETVRRVKIPPSFLVGQTDRITPYTRKWVSQYWQVLFNLVRDAAHLTPEEEQTILAINSAQPNDDHFSGSHDAIFFHNGTQFRAVEMMITELKRMLKPDDNDPIIRIEKALAQIQNTP